MKQFRTEFCLNWRLKHQNQKRKQKQKQKQPENQLPFCLYLIKDFQCNPCGIQSFVLFLLWLWLVIKFDCETFTVSTIFYRSEQTVSTGISVNCDWLLSLKYDSFIMKPNWISNVLRQQHPNEFKWSDENLLTNRRKKKCAQSFRPKNIL